MKLELAAGDRVKVSAAAGVVTGVVVDCTRSTDLPRIDGTDDQARTILQNGFTCVAIIEYRYGQGDVAFCALQTLDGQWFDLKASPLQIELIKKAAVN